MDREQQTASDSRDATDRDATDRPAADVERHDFADKIVDEVMPGDFDWRDLVRTYPLPALAAAVAGGFFLATRHGSELISAVTDFVDQEVSKNVQSLLDEHR